MRSASFDFFEQQELCRRASRRFVAGYIVAVALTVASYAAAGSALVALSHLYWLGNWRISWDVPLSVAGFFTACILAVSIYRGWQMRDGAAVAMLLGARYLGGNECSVTEKRLLDVVDEMSIASGVAAPTVYVMERESALNALVAGHSPHDAVLIITRGAVEKFSRDELQAVVAHEFSHILNGDMALNMRLAGLLAGLTLIGEQSESEVYAAARELRGVPREDQGAMALRALFGAFIAFVGFPGTLAAAALKASVSRQRELLADSAAVQFTRNAESVAGALDSIRSLGAATVLVSPGAGRLGHMFFAPALARWWDFPTHPPIEERIRHADPRFDREAYRARRLGRAREVAVLDGSGSIVKYAGPGVASVGQPHPEHVDFAAQLLARLPTRLREALRSPSGAERAMLALAGFDDGDLRDDIAALDRTHILAIAGLAVPAIGAQPQAERNRFLAEFARRAESDGRVSLREFVLFTFLRQRLREGAGAAVAVRFQKLSEVAADVQTVLFLLRAASGAKRAEIPAGTAVGAALERLRQLAPLEKPKVLEACVAAASADGRISFAEAELVRLVAATLDCPVPPTIDDSPIALQQQKP